MPMQIKILGAGILFLVILACYVPWTFTFEGGERHYHIERSAGYAFISDPPKLPRDFPEPGGVKVDVPRVLIPMAVVIFATVAGLFLTGGKGRG
jgi:hypothetical protein